MIRGGLGEEMGSEALEEEEDSEIEEEVKESMMDGTGKHFSTNGCKNKMRMCAVLGRPLSCVTGEPSIMPDTWLPAE